MPLLYYWRLDNYEQDLRNGVGFHLNQSSPRLHDIELGDSLWAFTRRPDGEYVMAAELVVKARTWNSPQYRYGSFRVWGDLRLSRYFLARGQASLDPVVRGLSVRVAPGPLGHSFQGHAAVRKITLADHQILSAVFAETPREPRARLQSEERLEAIALLGDAELVDSLLPGEQPALVADRAAYLYGGVPVTRTARLVHQLKERYAGRCQICQWSPRERYGVEVAEGHHALWISRGGADDLDNLVLLCPNHHRLVHRCEAPFDYRGLKFVFSGGDEPLTLNEHLQAA